jgi:tRNA (cmo5U34)-methyltransferase
MVNPVSPADKVYAEPQQAVSDFQFDDKVAEVFPDMIKRSVPGYETMIFKLGQLTQKFSQESSNLYDLGCSLGAATQIMQKHTLANHCKIIAVDNSQAMLERCRAHIQAFNFNTPVAFVLDDIQNINIENASVVSLNFTLQFIDPTKRQDLINAIYKGMRSGGLLFVSEKIAFADQSINDLLIELHHDFKRDNGYTELEISQKRSALEHVMKIDTFETHLQRFTQAGFKNATTWYQNMNFASMIAIK